MASTHISAETSQIESLKDLQQKLIQCALICEECEAACLNEENITLMARCIELTRDCADICIQGARLLQRQFEVADEYLLLIDKICKTCSEECRKHNFDYCQECANVCEACADATHIKI
jgi:hypothetical protein